MPASLIASTWPLLLGMGILMLGAGLQSTLLGVRAQAEGFPTAAIGVVMSCYYVGFLVGTTLAPRLIRGVGHVRVFSAFAAVAAASTLCQAVFVTPVVWGAMRLVTGVCLAGIYVVAESWLNDRATQETRSRLLALYMVVLYGGLGAAQFLLLVSDPGSDTPFMLVAALVCLAIVPLVLSAHGAPAVDTPRGVRFRDLYRRSPLGVVAVIMSGLMSSIVFSLGPVYARQSGMDDAAIAVFMAGSILAGVLTQYPVGMLADRLERRAVIAGVSGLAAALGCWLALWHGTPGITLLLAASLISGLVLSVYSLGVSHVNDRLETSEMVAASSALLLLNGAAAVVGPIVGGVLMERQGVDAYFATLAVIAAALMVFCVWRRTRRAPVPREQRGPFIKAQPETTAVTDESQWRDPAERKAG
ncbi:MAG: MFS transporter [Gammaproteobacteria bacterium]|nr:MFS transporter [Gammaproteobacteria bacterium]